MHCKFDMQGQGVIGAAWVTEADHGRWAGSPRGSGPAEQAHIDLGASWRGCGLTEVRVDWGASVYWVQVD